MRSTKRNQERMRAAMSASTLIEIQTGFNNSQHRRPTRRPLRHCNFPPLQWNGNCLKELVKEDRHHNLGWERVCNDKKWRTGGCKDQNHETVIDGGQLNVMVGLGIGAQWGWGKAGDELGAGFTIVYSTRAHSITRRILCQVRDTEPKVTMKPM